MSEYQDETAQDAIAIIGMACRFPGANDVEAFWQNLLDGRESITRFTDEELLAAGLPPERVAEPNLVKARGLIEDPELFDAAFFGISPREAELMDPQQRLFLQTCWQGLEAAGQVPSRIEGSVGVWGGMSTGMTNNTYLLSNLHADESVLDAADILPAMLGNENDYLCTRVAYKLNLRGPAINVQSACSTSLVAAAQAFQSLMTYGCDVAIAGGVSVSFPQKDGYLHQEGDIGSPDGHCRPFDEQARGTVFSNGVGVVVMKRLEDALEDDDHIYAVLRGAAINNDGSSKVSFAAPSVDGQAEVIATAQAIAEVEPDSISYVETHGTGTAIGDPIEIAGLTKAFGKDPQHTGYCGLGSVKSNFGHLDSAAGVAALIKTVLCLHHKTLVPTLHFRRPNPNIDFSDSPFYICAETKTWDTHALPRRAGVSGFGIGGTNAHLVLEEAPPRKPASEPGDSANMLVLSAKTEAALKQAAINLGDHIARHPQQALRDIAYTLDKGREHFRHRISLVAHNGADAAQALQNFDRSRLNPGKASAGPASIVFMFPGGGAQYLGMAAGLYEQDANFRADVDQGLALFRQARDYDLKAVWFAPADDEAAAREFERPAIQLPAIFILEMALARLWMRYGVTPDALLGHSLGENTAACLSGVLSYEDALGLVSLRGELFEQVAAGGMLSVSLAPAALEPYLDQNLCLATINAPEQCTVSGSAAAIEQLQERLAADDIEAQRIPIKVAAHSHLLEPILEAFGDYLRSVALHPPTIPIISNRSGQALTEAEATSPDYWVQHLRHTVRFADGVTTLAAEKHRVFLEVGPGKVLGSLVRLQQPAFATRVVASLRHPQENIDDRDALLNALGKLWCAGGDIDWSATGLPTDGRLVPLPTYPFQGKRFLIEPPSGPARAVQVPGNLADPATLIAATVTAPVTSPTANAASPQGGSSVPSKPRPERILDILRGIIHELSGLDLDDIDPDVSFVDMGFDSLFLTQANLRFKKEFKVKITFRQLFDDAPCLDALANYIDQQLPEDAMPEEVAPTAEPSQAAVAAPQSPAQLPQVPAAAGGDALMQALALQIQASNALFAALQGGGSAPSVAPAPMPPAATPTAPAAPQVAEEPPAETFKARQLGPYKPLDAGSGGLSEAAKSALDRFIAAYAERTAGSKALAGEQRGVLSDARSISGFRADWKEMVYQIAAGKGSKGSRVYDIDGNEYIDLTSGFGVNIFGYSPEGVVEAVQEQLQAGFELGTLSPLAKEAAELISELTGMERSTFTNTGSEAISAAVRAARTTTGKDKIAVFYDEYHGISDEVLVNFRKTNGERHTIPTSPGIPHDLVQNVIVLEYQDPRCIDIIRENADELAAVIIEPVQNRNPAFRNNEWFPEIRQVTRDNDIAMIFDEMITGFRLHPGGAQAYFGVEVDMVCYGKIVCGGLPLAVLSGRGEYLDCFDGGPWQFGDDSFPEAGVTFFGGTYTRHPLSLASSVAALRYIKSLDASVYDELNRRSRRFANQLNEIIVGMGFPARIENRESIFNLKFNDDNPFNRLIFWYLRHKGVLIYDRPFFISTAHSDADFDFVKEAFRESIAELQAGGIVPPTDLGGNTGDSRLIPFTEAQSEIWLATLLGKDASRAYHEQVIYHLHEAVDIDAMRHAVQKVVARHEGLRATVAESGDGIVIAPARYLPAPLIDLSGESDAAGKAAFDRLVVSHLDDDFDLHQGPLIRLSLVKLAEDHFVLLWAAHHLVIDGWSMGIMLQDLAEYYAAACDNRKFGALAEQQLSHFMQEESEHRDSEEFQASEAYWLEQFAEGVPDPVELPLDHSRPPLKTFNGNRLAVPMDPALCQGLREFSHDHNCTLFTSLFTAFSVLLHKLSNQHDLVVGVPVAGQAVWGQPELVGHCVSFLPFRIQLDEQARYQDLLQQTRDTILDANEHQQFTYGSLLKNLPINRDPGRAPLVSAIFNLDQGMESFSFNGAEARYAVCPRHYVKHDLFFNVVEEDATVTLEVDHNSDLFDAASVSRWIDIYLNLLRQLLATPEQAISQLRSLEAVEYRKLEQDWNATARDYPLDDTTLVSLFEACVDANPDAPALSMGEQQLSYRQLEERANCLANTLIERGIGRDQVVPLMMERSEEMVVALYGILKAGAAYLPLDPDYPGQRLQFILEQCDAPLVLVQQQFEAAVPAGFNTLAVDSTPGQYGDGDSSRPANLAGPDDLAYVIYTSGSTGQPKGVMIEHRAVCNRLLWMAEDYPLGSGDSVLQKTPYTFDVSVWEFFLPLMCGARLVLAEPEGHKSPDYLAALINAEGITQLHFVPSMLRAFLADESANSCDGLKRVICSGEALDLPLQRAFFAALPGVELHNFYGPTEAAIDVSAWRCDKDQISGAVPIGRPVANTRLYVLDSQLQIQPLGVQGELYIGGIQLARGYLQRPELTEQAFVADPFSDEADARLYRTGDLAKMRADGAIEYIGRRDSQVKLRGLRIELAEIDAVLAQADAVAASATIVREDREHDPRLVAYIVYRDGASMDDAALRNVLRQHVPDYMVPQHFVQLDQLPLTGSGKLDRKALPLPDTSVAAETYIAPANEVEEMLASTWREVLDLERVGSGDNFFDIGGHSLSATQMLSRVRQDFGVDVPLRGFFSKPTVGGLAELVDECLNDQLAELSEEELEALIQSQGNRAG